MYLFSLLPGFKFKGNFHGDKQQLLFKASGNQSFPKDSAHESISKAYMN